MLSLARQELVNAVRENPAVIIVGETGSGKTTRETLAVIL